jgi:hypothetical protein
VSKHYVNNKQLHIELVVSKAQGRLTSKANHMLYLIGKNLHRKMRYNNTDDAYDTLQEGFYQIYKNWISYDPDKFDNALAFISEVFKRAMARGWNTLKERNSKTGFQPIKASYYTNDDAGNPRPRI